MLFARKKTPSPAKVLRLIRTRDWRQVETLRVTQKPRWDPNPEIRHLVIRRETIGELALTPMRWGLLRDEGASGIELRPLTSVWAESVRDQTEWRRMLNAQRCLVPVDQFFEWQRVRDIKTREFGFKLRSGQPMMIAGLWNRTTSIGLSFAYISCPSNELTSLIHGRMPVILDQSAIAAWFNPESSLESLVSLLKAVDQNSLEVRPIASTQAHHHPNQPSLFDRYAA